MDKIKEALKKAFDGNVEDGVLDEMITTIEVKIEEKANEKVDASKVVFEAAIETKNAEEMKEFKSKVIENINKFSDLAVTEFIEENKSGIESDAIVEMSKAVLSGLAGIMKEHNLDIPENDVDIVKQLEAKTESLTIKVNEGIQREINLTSMVESKERELVFTESTFDLTDTDKEKVSSFIEGMEIPDITSYKSKLDAVIKNVSESSGDKNRGHKDVIPDIDKFEEDVANGNTKADMLLS